MDPFLGEIRLMPFTFAPRDWANCDGQILNINQSMALYSLLNTRFGGDGRSTFALPDFRGRVAIHPDFHSYAIGSKGGDESVALTQAEVPSHSHAVTVSQDEATVLSPGGNRVAKGKDMEWLGPKSTPAVAMAADVLSTAGSGAGHENRMPSQVVRFCIAMQGIYPPRE